MESKIAKKVKESVKTTVSVKGYILCYVVVKDPRSSDFVLKYGLEMLIEGGRMNIIIDVGWNRSGGWADTLTRTKTRIRSWGAWVERWFGREINIPKMLYTEFILRWGWNNNKGGINPNRLAKFSLKGILMITINFVECRVGDN